MRARWLLAAVCALGCAVAPTPAARTDAYLASIRGEGALQSEFFRAMPKGGDLHLHLSGAVYAESYLRWAVEDGMCVRRNPGAILEPPCDVAVGREPAEVLQRDGALFRQLVDAFSMRNFDVSRTTGHDHFFATFDAFDARRARNGDALAEVAARLARQNTWYVEVMQSLGVSAVSHVGHELGWDADLPRFASRVAPDVIDRAVAEATSRIDAQELRMRAVLRCDRADRDPGCDVTVRYLVAFARTDPREEVFVQSLAAAAIAQREPRVVGVNLLAPEDDRVACRDYTDHMRIMSFATDHGRRVNLALHAGELTPSLVPPEDVRGHVREAVEVAGARRIGHGTDLAYETDPAATLALMARGDVAVEHCLTSAEVILGVRGADHPFALYQRGEVPQVICTDDEGVSRSDLSREYERAEQWFSLPWPTLKQLARNALSHAFVAGDGLWRAQGELAGACAGDEAGGARPSAACRRFLDGSERARLQWRLEGDLRAFERRW